MGHEFVNGQKDDKEQNEAVKRLVALDRHNSVLAKTTRIENSDHTLVNSRRSVSSGRCTNGVIFQRVYSLHNRIPKDLVSLDEKYLQHCLKLIHNNALKMASFKVSVNLNEFTAGVPSESFNLTNQFRVGEKSDCSTKLVFDCSLATGTGKVVATPAGHWIVGSIMESKSMINIMRNPLFHRSGTLDGTDGISNLRDLRDNPFHKVVSSPSQLSLCSSIEQGKEIPISGANNKYGIDTKHQRFLSVTSTNSTSTDTDKSSPSASVPAAVSQGMLLVTWKGGIPHFVFSLDEQKKIYVTNLMGTEPTNSGSPQHLYLFYTKPHGQKNVVQDKESCILVGRMKVTTSLFLCVNNSKVLETEFVLSTSCEISEESQDSADNLRKNKRLPKKIVGLFKNSQSSKQRSISRFDGTTNPISEDSFLDISRDACSNLDALGNNEIVRSYTPTNFELAAIVVRAHCRENEQQVEGGGWGLKFLRRGGVKKIPKTSYETLPSDCCTRNAGNCSTSIDVIIPAGIHGGPRTRNGGPSTLTERWKSGGECDCGGWDLGCPLTVLRTRSTEEEVPATADIQDNTKQIELYLQGSKQCRPSLRMINVHEGLYVVHFQSNLSALQSFSIAVAHIHSQSSILQPKLCDLNQ